VKICNVIAIFVVLVFFHMTEINKSPEKVGKFLILYLYISFILQVSALIYYCVKSRHCKIQTQQKDRPLLYFSMCRLTIHSFEDYELYFVVENHSNEMN